MINKNSFQDSDYYFSVHSFMIRDLGLRDSRLLVYAVIYGFSNDGEKTFYGTLDLLSKCIGKGKTATWEAVKRLIDDGFILVEKGEKFEHKEYVVNPEKLKFLSLRSKIKALDECIANSKLSKTDSEPQNFCDRVSKTDSEAPKSCDRVSEIDSEASKSCSRVSETDSEYPKTCSRISKTDSESFNYSQQGTQDGQNSHTRMLNSHTEVSENKCEGIGILLPGYRNPYAEVSETDNNNKHNNKHNNKCISNLYISADAEREERKNNDLKRIFDFSNTDPDAARSYLSALAKPQKRDREYNENIENKSKSVESKAENNTQSRPRNIEGFKSLRAASDEEFEKDLERMDKLIAEIEEKLKLGTFGGQ